MWQSQPNYSLRASTEEGEENTYLGSPAPNKQSDCTRFFQSPRKTWIECPLCEADSSKQGCIACNKTGRLTLQSPFSKFVTSIMQFKMEKVPELPRSKQCSGIVSTAPLFRSSIPTPRDAKYSSNIRKYNVPFRLSTASEQSEEVHRNIGCDQCQQFPIRGKRYKCDECPDFDLCQTCYPITNHVHLKSFREVTKPKSSIRRAKLKLHASTLNVSERVSKIQNMFDNLRKLF